MKKIVSIILALLIFTGCGSDKTNITPVTKGITFDCDVTYYNEVYKCRGDVKKNGEMLLEFVSPAEIDGLKFNFTKKGVTVNFKGIEYISRKTVFENSVATFINQVLTNPNDKVVKENDVFYTEGVTDDFEYKLQLGGTGLPIKITTRPDATEVVFKNVKIK